MDPLFELAGTLLAACDDQWISRAVPTRAARASRDEASDSDAGAALDDAIARCRRAIDEIRRSFESLRARRELLTERLYEDGDLALAAVRVVGRYPSYIEDVAPEVEAARNASDPTVLQELADSERRLGGLSSRFSPPDSMAARLLVDRAFALRVTRQLRLPQPFAFVLQQELDEIEASRAWRLAPHDANQRPGALRPAEPAAPTPASSAARGPVAATAAEEGAVEPAGTAPGGYRQHAVRTALTKDLFGLSLSGGGIRSATFGLGVLQALSDLDLLRRVDYLSTVSGGGYIASWLLGWIKRLHGGVHEVQQRLCPARAPHPSTVEARPIRMLREYSNYLTPRAAFLSGDTWTMVAIWLRNTLLNLLVILSLLVTVLVIPRWVVPFSFMLPPGELLRIFAVTLLLAVVCIARNLATVDDANGPVRASDRTPPARGSASGAVLATIVVPIVIGAFAASAWIWKVLFAAASTVPEAPESSLLPSTPLERFRAVVTLAWMPWLRDGADTVIGWGRETLPQLTRGSFDGWLSGVELGVFAIVAGLMFGGLVIIQLFGGYARCIVRSHGPDSRLAHWAAFVGWCLPAALVPAVVGGVLAALLVRLVGVFPADRSYWFTAAFIPPLMMEALAVTVALHIGLLGRDFPDERREWWSRLGAYQLLIAATWAIAFACTAFAPALFEWTWEYVPAVATWIVVTWGGVLIAKGGDIREANGGRWRERVAVAAPYVFAVGLVIGVSALVHVVIFKIDCGSVAAGAAAFPDNLTRCPPGVTAETSWADWATLGYASTVTPFSIFAAAGLVCLVLSWRVDVNEFSMHHFYRNRLVRCYLGASRDQETRRPNRFTGLDPSDDVKLSDLRLDLSPEAAAGHSTRDRGLPFVGPYPIINVALNLTKGRELAWQERKAESFVFTPHFTGYELTEDRPSGGGHLGRAGYRPTEAFAYPHGPGLGTAAAISGAAANPNMGYHSSPATAFLLTVFNARLGWWVGNPRYRIGWRVGDVPYRIRRWLGSLRHSSQRFEPWRTPSPRLGLMYLLSELTGGADNRTRYVNVSDGGHFENLGIYELVRRRCRYILAVDAEEDAALAFAGLANVVRKCRADFGVSIDLDLDAVRREGTRSRAHCTAGRIYYPEPGASPGHILYFKSSLTGDEPPDVLEYESRSPAFPHQSTGDQWFDESQFESYRILGYHVGRDALSLAVRTELELNTTIAIPSVFSRLHDLWTPAAGTTPALAARHAELYAQIHRRVHAEVGSGAADTLLFPPPPSIDGGRDALYVAHSMVELMHQVFVDLRLDDFADRPHNTGWMRIFQRWIESCEVAAVWARVAGSYSDRFQSFVRRLPTWRPGNGFH